MSEAPNCAELDGQHPELLPTCTVLSLFSAAGGGRGGNGGAAAPGGVGKGGLGLNLINLFGEQTNYAVTAGAARRRQYRRYRRTCRELVTLMSLGDHVVRAVTGGVTGGHPSHVVVWA